MADLMPKLDARAKEAAEGMVDVFDERHPPGMMAIATSFVRNVARASALATFEPADDLRANAAMSAMLVLTWTMVETLGKDLWIEALNARPRPLAVRAMRDGARSGEPRLNDREKSVPLSDLERFGFDLRGRMGTLLVERRKFRVDTYGEMRAAYSAAFGDKVLEIFDREEVAELMTSLEGIRNAIVHRGGVADETFVRIYRSPRFAGLNVGDEIPLKSEAIALIVDEAIIFSAELCIFISDWFVENPDAS